MSAGRTACAHFGPDGSLHHLHVAITPFLETFIQVNESLKQERKFRIIPVRMHHRRLHNFGWFVLCSHIPLQGARIEMTSMNKKIKHRVPQAWLVQRILNPGPSIGAGHKGIQNTGITATQDRLQFTELGGLKSTRGIETITEAIELKRGHRLEDVDLGHQCLDDGADTSEKMKSHVNVSRIDDLLGAREFMQNRLEPQLITLVNNDEQQLIVLWTIRQWHLQIQEFVHLEVTAVGNVWHAFSVGVKQRGAGKYRSGVADLRFPQDPASPLRLDGKFAIGSLNPVGRISFGCWRLIGTDSENSLAVNAAVDAGITLVDNADVYGLDWGGTHFGACEEALGRIFTLNKSLRDRVVLATKAGIIPGIPYESSATYLVNACEASLRRMQVDHVDLFQIHRPDHFTHPQEIAQAFTVLRERGLAREFGVSNYTVAQTRALMAHLGFPLATTQPEYSAVALEPLRNGTLDLCMETNITPLAWSPLAGGRLATGDGVRPELMSALTAIAHRENVSIGTVAISFVLAHPSSPIAIVGTQKPERLVEYAAASTITLTRADVYSIIQSSDGVPLP